MFDDLGELERRDGTLQLRFVRRLAQTPDQVFDALTQPEHLRAWFPTDIIGERTTVLGICGGAGGIIGQNVRQHGPCHPLCILR